MADIKSETAFGRAAVSFDVHESDYYVLIYGRINTLETLAFRFPESADFESYLRKVVRTTAGYKDEHNQVQTYPRPRVVPWEEYRQEDDAACLRKLWTLATKASQKAMERLAGDDGDTKAKVTITRAQELEDRAIESGMPVPASDKERPSLHTLTRVQGAFGPGGSFQHLNWECFVSMEVENRLRRAGKLPKDKREFYVDDKDKLGLKAKEDTDSLEAEKVEDILGLQDVLELRARAMHMLEVCQHKVVMDYSSRIIGLLRATAPEGMRAPTLNEARKADREIMGEILKWVGKGKGNVEAALTHYASTPDADLWKLMAQQIESYPDQGLDRKTKSGHAEPAKEKTSKRKSPEAEGSGAGPRDYKENPRLCLVCKKRHEPRCELTAEWRAEQKQKKKEARAKAKKGKGKGESSKRS